MSIEPADSVDYDLEAPILVVGGGACGLTAALAAHDRGVGVLVVEREPVPSGSTALSSGMVPACGTAQQHAKGVKDSPTLMPADIQRKAGSEADPAVVAALCENSGPTLAWLSESHGVAFELVDGFLYPGHSVMRMHAPLAITSAALIGSLTGAAEAAGIDIVTNALVTTLFAEPDGRVRGVGIVRPDGSGECIGCEALVLACNGYGGNPEMVRRHIPEMAEAEYFGHPGNQGDAVRWGETLGGEARHMSAYQGHGSVAVPHRILITWALMMEGGIQVNAQGERFSNEHHGYSEQSVAVLSQPGGVAWNIYDARLHQLGRGFEDYRTADAQGAVKTAPDAPALAAALGLPADALAASIAETHETDLDRFGRDLGKTPRLEPPFFAVKVAGALFHTQGGLRIDGRARVLKRGSDTPLPNLLAGGGAACGVSGSRVEGYLSGNGLLSAVVLGRIAGETAGIFVK